MVGTTLGIYRIDEEIGRGGMGQVYRAHDTALNRDVAIKVLADGLGSDPDRLMRFEREAQALAALNHPNIAHIYGLEKSGETPAIVMELVEGPTLADRIAKGPIPLDEALPIARQIAEALEAAHERGIIHRDLKPANIKVRDDGTVKVLDFGLARAFAQDGLAAAAEAMEAPTVTSPAMTQAGMILGTAAYMAPEQARGRPMDKRVDVWAFGVVLYEMLVGIRPFVGDDVTDVLAAVVRAEPDWDALPAATSPLIGRLLQRCLTKEPRQRLHDIADARLDLDEASATPVPAAPSDGPIPSSGWIRTALVFALGVATTAAAYQIITGVRPTAVTRLVTTSIIRVTPADEIGGVDGLPPRLRLALSPDGRTLVFSAMRDGQRSLYLRNLDNLVAAPISGTQGGDLPFFSPDGQWIGYWAEGQLWKIRITGGPPVPLCRQESLPFGATWTTADRIVFGNPERAGGLREVPSGGGQEARDLTTLDASRGETSHRLPQALPGNGGVLFTIRRGDRSAWSQAEVAVYSPQTATSRIVVTGGADARYVETTPGRGYLVYVREGVLMAAPFDLAALTVTGDANPVGNVLQSAYARYFGDDIGAGQFSLARDGTLAYVPGGVFPAKEDALVLVDRAGNARDVNLPRGTFVAARVSRDGRVAVGTSGKNADLLVAGLDHPPFARLRTAGATLGNPIWIPDGTRLAYRSDLHNGRYNIFWRLSDGTGEEALTDSPHYQVPASWTPDGQVLAFYEAPVGGGRTSIRLLSIADGKTRRLTTGEGDESGADFSHDGRAIAYVTDESGADQVYVETYPRRGERIPVSTDGGFSPAWGPGDRELFYLKNGPTAGQIEVWSRPIVTTPDLKVLGPPAKLFDGDYAVANKPARFYDITPDGKFLMIRADDRWTPVTEVILVQNWVEELKRLVPVR